MVVCPPTHSCPRGDYKLYLQSMADAGGELIRQCPQNTFPAPGYTQKD